MRIYPALRVKAVAPNTEFADLVAAALDDFGLIALQETNDEGTVCAYLADSHARPAAERALRAELPGVEVDWLDVPDENWAERSQASLRAVRVGELIVAPPWDAAADPAHTIVIVPSMGFGTGHHATTRLCLAALQAPRPARKSVLDIGTGSGVLAIAAARLGAARVVAIDNDQDAIGNAQENAALNGVAVDLRRASIEDDDIAADPFDVVTANLTGAMLARSAGAIEQLAENEGTLILSGLQVEEEGTVVAAFRKCRFQSRQTEDGWVCVVLQRTQA